MQDGNYDVRACIWWMLLSTACFSAGNSAVRMVALELHPFQIGFLTNLVVLSLIWPALRDPMDPETRPMRQRLYTLTAFFGGVSNLAWFDALAKAPLAEATAVTFAAPIVVTALAGVAFGETVPLARWIAILAGFAGVLLVVRPGRAALDAGMISVLVATAGMSGTYIVSKRPTAVDGMRRTAAMMTLIPVVVGPVPAAWVWKTPSLNTMFWVLVMAGAMFAGRVTMLLAFRSAAASTLMPLDFSRLPFIATIAWRAFGEVPDRIAMAGAALIVAASAFIARQGRAANEQSMAG